MWLYDPKQPTISFFVSSFRGCIQLTGHGLRTLSDHCPNVEVLSLKDCRSLSTASIGCFLQTATQLRVLDLSGVDSVKNSTLLTISQLSQLEKLNFAWCRNITGHGLQAVGQGCPKLRHLKLNGCPMLDEPTMAALGQHLSHLTHLCLAFCTSLNDTALLAFLQTSCAPLSHLNLTSCARLSDSSLRHIAQHCTQLTHLELAGCVLLTDQGFSYLAPRLRTLVHLDLEDLQHITGITVRALADHQANLTRLCLSNCSQITDDAITHLLLHGVCRKLEHLELDNCTVSDETLNTIAVYLTTHPPSPTTPDSSFSFSSASESRRFNVEVLDCANITESGVRSALAKASPMLTIKSFYSWQEDEQDDDEEDEEDHRLQLRMLPARRATASRRRYNTIGRQRRRRDGTGQPHAANCIIL